MTNKFAIDDKGPLKQLGDGQVMRVNERLYNTILTVSSSPEDDGWHDGW